MKFNEDDVQLVVDVAVSNAHSMFPNGIEGLEIIDRKSYELGLYDAYVAMAGVLGKDLLSMSPDEAAAAFREARERLAAKPTEPKDA